ncbi:MAG: hypothetical protein WC953_02945 [Pseudomonas sp.]
MKGVTLSAAVLLIGLTSSAVMADEVVAEMADTTAGAGLGASTGLMIGGAAGGPLGALVGAGVGLLAGQFVQQASGLEGRAYKVRTEQGDIDRVRSPGAEFHIGQQVERHGNRLYAQQD